jgi:hypothetical protein
MVSSRSFMVRVLTLVVGGYVPSLGTSGYVVAKCDMRRRFLLTDTCVRAGFGHAWSGLVADS